MITHHQLARHSMLREAGGLEWEELPSLASALRRHVPQASHALAAAFIAHAQGRHARDVLPSEPPSGPVWTETMPSELDALAPSEPFRETMTGLQSREVNEPDVFRHFFGDRSRR